MDRAQILAEMATMSTATISDAMFRLGHKNRTMDHRIKPVSDSSRVCGPACTAHAYPGATHASGLALEAAQPGDVIVIDAQGFLGAVMWGEIFSLMAVAKGVAGTVIDGAVRDIAEVRELGYPLFAAGVHRLVDGADLFLAPDLGSLCAQGLRSIEPAKSLLNRRVCLCLTCAGVGNCLDRLAAGLGACGLSIGKALLTLLPCACGVLLLFFQLAL